MRIKCPSCSKVLSIPESAAGKIVKCPCGKQLRAPGNTATAAPARPAANPAAPQTAAGRTGNVAGKRSTGVGGLDPGIFDELTDQDLQPIKTGSAGAVGASGGRSGNLLNQYAPQGGAGRQANQQIAGVLSRIFGANCDGMFISLFIFGGAAVGYLLLPTGAGQEPEEVLAQKILNTILVASVASLIPQIINAVLIAKSGQSLGKKIVKTRIVDQQTGAPAGFVQGFLMRNIVFGFITGLPVVGGFIALADIIYLFVDNHQTLHDKLANTLVVKA